MSDKMMCVSPSQLAAMLKGISGVQKKLVDSSIAGDMAGVSIALAAQAEVDYDCPYHSGTTTALIAAAGKGNLEVVKVLLGAGADVDKKLNSGYNATMAAAHAGRIEVIRELIRVGADVNGQLNAEYLGHPPRQLPHAGYNALMYAALGGHTEVLKELLEADADAQATNGAGLAATEIAINAFEPEAAKMLDEHLGVSTSVKLDDLKAVFWSRYFGV